MENINQENIGKMLKQVRLNRNLTQTQLADKVGKKRSYISRIEGEEGNNIKLKTLIEVIEKGFGGKIKITF
jgi:transcriptional regulator with XRE-family HTH domain